MYLDSPFHDPILVIVRKKLGGPGDHWAVRFPNGQVADIVDGIGVRLLPSDDAFAQGHDVTIIREVPVHLNHEVMHRLRIVLAERKPYHATQWNCEMFANWLTGEEPESLQVKGWIVLAATAVVLKALSA